MQRPKRCGKTEEISMYVNNKMSCNSFNIMLDNNETKMLIRIRREITSSDVRNGMATQCKISKALEKGRKVDRFAIKQKKTTPELIRYI